MEPRVLTLAKQWKLAWRAMVPCCGRMLALADRFVAPDLTKKPTHLTGGSGQAPWELLKSISECL